MCIINDESIVMGKRHIKKVKRNKGALTKVRKISEDHESNVWMRAPRTLVLGRRRGHPPPEIDDRKVYTKLQDKCFFFFFLFF